MNRRNFFRFVTGGALGAAASGVSVEGISRLNAALSPPEPAVPGGTEAWKLGVCTLCEGGCGLRVRCIGKRVVKVQGNPLDPVNRGGLCPKGLAAVQELYHPDRLRAPRKNTGTRTAPRWKEITWEEATAALTARLRELRSGGQAHTVAWIDGNRRSATYRLMRRFLEAYGSPKCLGMPSGLDSLRAAMLLQQDVERPPAFDWENTRYLLSFGVNFLEGWGAPAAIMRAFGRWRDSTSGRTAKFVQVDPRLSVTAARADEWVAVKPGTEAALALGMAYVLLTEDLYDVAFVRDHTTGFEEFRSLVLSEYRLDDVADRTGVPAEHILRLAREFAQNRPAVALGDHQTSTLAGEAGAAMAVHSLNALAGSIGVRGGVLLQQEVPLGEPAAGEGTARVADLAGLSALLLHDADPVFTLASGEQFRRALTDVPFVACFTSFYNDSAALADLILPVPTGLERWQALTSPPGFPQAVYSLAAPVIAPRHRTREAAEVMLEVARGLRGPVAAALSFGGMEEYLKQETARIFAAQTGGVFTSGREEAWNRVLERSGWWAPSYSSAEELWTQMRERGGWWEASYLPGEAQARFAFQSSKLAARREPPPAGYPLLLHPIEVLPLSGGYGGHLPYLQQIAGLHLSEAWESWMEIHPQTARKLKIGEGDRVWVESRRGRAQVRARLYEGAHPEVVYLPMGYGRAEGGEWGRQGVNVLRLLGEQVWDTRVKVYRS